MTEQVSNSTVATALPSKPDLVSAAIDRRRLYPRLRDWSDYRAIFVHAPAGFGKTTFVSLWLDSIAPGAGRVCWLSLDETDCDPAHFVTHVAMSLEAVSPEMQSSAELWLSYMTPVQVIARLMAQMDRTIGDSDSTQPAILVLDDFHRASSAEIDALLSELLDTAPAGLVLILISRQAEATPLNRLYVTGEVLEIVPDDLRMDRAELHQYLAGVGMHSLDPAKLDQILARTEGWFAALQLVRISLSDVGDIDNLLAGLRGDSRRLFSYLSQEIIAQQPESDRQFLLRTSILDRFNASLAAAVSNEPNAYGLIDKLKEKNLFIRSLDQHNEWHRYHPLFQESLQHALRRELPEADVATLHRRAADWLTANRLIPEAVTHYVASGAHDAAAANLSALVDASTLSGNTHEAQRLLDTMPPELRRNPLLCLNQVTLDSLIDRSDRLDNIALAHTAIEESSLADAKKSILETILMIHEVGALYQQGDITAAIRLMEKVRPYVDSMDAFNAQLYEFLSMHLAWRRGQVGESLQHGQKAIDLAIRAGFPSGEIAIQREMAKKAQNAGQAERATHQFEQVIATSKPTTSFAMRELFWTHNRAADNAYWMGQWTKAVDHHREALSLAEQLGDESAIRYSQCLSLLYDPARNKMGDWTVSAAIDLSIRQRDRIDYLRQQAQYVRILIRHGRYVEAVNLAHEYGVFPPDQATMDRSALAIEGLYAAIAAGRELKAVRKALLVMIDSYKTLATHRFQTLRLRALAAWLELRLDQPTSAMAHLDEALTLSAESGYIGVILDLPDLHYLLEQSRHPFARHLLKQWPPETVAGPGIELTPKERQVLYLLANAYEYQQIATELHVSLNTVRTHVRHVYRKLGVNSRDQAVETSRRLGLIT